MKSFTFGTVSAATIYLATTVAALAWHRGGTVTPPVNSVPEIDVTAGLAAVAAVLAAIAFVWERNRRLKRATTKA